MTGSRDDIQAALQSADTAAVQRLLPLVYDELHRLAHHHMRRESPGNSLHTTALVHEAYLRLADKPDRDVVHWDNRGHFLAAAAQAMRRILVDRARARGTKKRGGQMRRKELFEISDLAVDEIPAELIDLDEALTRLAKEAPRQANLVALRFFSGLTIPETAAVLGVSTNTAERDWTFARAWLLAAMDGDI